MVVVPGARPVLRRHGSAWFPLGLVLLAGVVVGLLWAVLAPVGRQLSDATESQAAGDGVLALLCLLAGLGTTVLVVLRPGPNPAARLVLVLLVATGGGGLAWGVGRLAGAPVLHVPGVLLLWPLTVSVISLVRAVIGLLIHGE